MSNIQAIDFAMYVAGGKWRSSLEPASALGAPRSVRFDEVPYEHEEYPKVLNFEGQQVLVTSRDEEEALKEAFEASKPASTPQAPAQSQNRPAQPPAAVSRPVPPSQPMRPGVR